MPRVIPCAVVGLHAGGIEADEAPSRGHELPFVGRIAVGVQLRRHEERGFLERLPRGVVREDLPQ